MFFPRRDDSTVAGHENLGNAERDLLVDMLLENTAMWRTSLGQIASEVVTWQPFARGHSVGGILLHIADFESKMMWEVVRGEVRPRRLVESLQSELNRPEVCDWVRPYVWPLSDYYVLLDMVRSHTVETIYSCQLPLEPAGGEDACTLRHLVLKLIAHEAFRAGQIDLHKLHHGWGGVEPVL